MAGVKEDVFTTVHSQGFDDEFLVNVSDDVHPMAVRIQKILMEYGVPAASGDEIISIVDVLAAERDALLLILADTVQNEST